MTLQKQNLQRSIYLADDDDEDRMMFAEALLEVDQSIQLTQAEDGKELMDILYVLPASPLPEVVFLDINMPRKTGFECLEEIRNHGGNLKNLNIIIFSTSNDPGTIAKANQLGALYAVKPNSFQGLKVLLTNVLQMDWLSAQNQGFKIV